LGLAFAAIGATKRANEPGAAGAFVVVGLISLIALCKSLINRATTEIAVTTHRVIFKRGLIARDTIEINFNRIESLDVRQPVVGRVLDYGTVIVRGTGIGAQPMRYISAPLEFRNAAFGDINTAPVASSLAQF
jgi:uncharacterized membrane protein YdbT with pleckstrin-like domain